MHKSFSQCQALRRMIHLWIILSHAVLSHGKYLLIETGHNITNKDYMTDDSGSGCKPALIKSGRQIECGRDGSNCFMWEVMVNTAEECKAKVKRI